MRQLMLDWHGLVPLFFFGFFGVMVAIKRLRIKAPSPERYHVPKGSHLFRPPTRPTGPHIAGRK